jgi:hypothetical protein
LTYAAVGVICFRKPPSWPEGATDATLAKRSVRKGGKGWGVRSGMGLSGHAVNPSVEARQPPSGRLTVPSDPSRTAWNSGVAGEHKPTAAWGGSGFHGALGALTQ